MMKPNFEHVCIAGAGAIGCTLAARLAKTGIKVDVLARGKTLTAIREHGIHLDDLEGAHQVQVNAHDNPHELGKQSLIFICTKAQALPSILASLQPMMTRETLVVPIVNGVPWWYFHGLEAAASPLLNSVDPEGMIDRLLPATQVIGAITFITAQTQAPGQVRSTNPYLITLGELTHQPSERVQAVCELLERAGIEGRPCDRIRDPLWTKIIANLSSNPLSVVSGATLDQLYADPKLAPLVRRILDETLLVAAAYGARINFAPPTFMEMGAAMGAVKTSMLQDYLAGRPLELATIGDAVVELAARVGIAMPVTQHVLSLAHFLADHRQAHAA